MIIWIPNTWLRSQSEPQLRTLLLSQILALQTFGFTQENVGQLFAGLTIPTMNEIPRLIKRMVKSSNSTMGQEALMDSSQMTQSNLEISKPPTSLLEKSRKSLESHSSLLKWTVSLDSLGTQFLKMEFLPFSLLKKLPTIDHSLSSSLILEALHISLLLVLIHLSSLETLFTMKSFRPNIGL